MGFYSTGSSGTVTGPEEYDPEAACKKIYEGLKGLGTNENALVEVIASHTNEQRQEIKDKYKTMYGKDLGEDLEGELGGSFAKIVLALMKEPEEYIIESINQAISGLGTDEYGLIGLLCTRTNDELEQIKKAYKEKYEKDMEEDVSEDLSGDFRSLIIGIINGGRDESDEVDSEKVQEDAKNLHEASEGAGTREEIFQSIFNQRSYEHMRQVFDAYKELADGKEIEELIESEFSGSIQACYLALVKIFRNVSEFYAEMLRAAIKGAGTDDENLIRILVLRSEVDLKDVIEVYETRFGSNLSEDVSSDTSGDYRLILERLLMPSSTDVAVEEEITAKDAGEGELTVAAAAADGEEEAVNNDEADGEAGAGEGADADAQDKVEDEIVEATEVQENDTAAPEEETKEEVDEVAAEEGSEEKTEEAAENDKGEDETKEDGEAATDGGDEGTKEEDGGDGEAKESEDAAAATGEEETKEDGESAAEATEETTADGDQADAAASAAAADDGGDGGAGADAAATVEAVDDGGAGAE